MQKAFSLILAVLILAACHRHTIVVNTAAAAPANGTSISIAKAVVIVVDAHGNIVAAAKDLPAEADKSILNPENAHSYTPEQTKKLAYRFKYVPPKILYVPAALAKTTNRGTYYVYNNKFWYWKKPNGYYYLDETYYN